MTALEFAAWMIAHPDAQYEKLVALFESLDVFEQEALRAAMRAVADRETGPPGVGVGDAIRRLLD